MLKRETGTPAAARFAAIEQGITSLRACAHWLDATRIRVLDVHFRRADYRPEITVEASPRLRILLGDDCANHRRGCDCRGTFYGWIAVRYGCLLRWEEFV